MTHDDGGPAYPIQELTVYRGTVSFGTAKDHGPEEPDEDGYTPPPYRNGMSIRDKFAAAALTGVLASETNATYKEFAESSYKCADAMLAERRKRREEG